MKPIIDDVTAPKRREGARVNGPNQFAIPYPDAVNAVSLSAGVAESITVPSDADIVIFSATADFYANYSTTATVPDDVTDGSACELNPVQRTITGLSAISVISEAACKITAAFYSYPTNSNY